MAAELAIDLTDRQGVETTMPLIMDALHRCGIILLEGALPRDRLLFDVRKHAARLPELQAVYESHKSSATERIISRQVNGMGLRVESTSVVYYKAAVDPTVSQSCRDLLWSLRTRMLAGHQTDAEARPRFEAFCNYYMAERQGVIAFEHADKSLITILTAAFDLANPEGSPLPGFEYIPPGKNSFVELVPRTANAVIVMCGRETQQLLCRAPGYPSTYHRVRNICDVAHRRRFTMVFTTHIEGED
jgi:hypothetical protein